jgi:hypothetical protein
MKEKKQLHAVLLSYNLTPTEHFPTRIQNQSNIAIDNIFIGHYKFTKYAVSPVYSGLSDHEAQLLTIKDTNLQTANHPSYSIRNINKYSRKNLKIDSAIKSWDSIFGNNDNMDVAVYIFMYFDMFYIHWHRLAKKKRTYGIK